MNQFIKKSSLSIKNAGFTLIELLVVVLIIGILAAVALPQYQLVVAKNRIARYLPLMRTLQKSQEQYYLANGQYSTNIRDLDIECQRYGTGAHENWCYLDSKGKIQVHIDEGRYFILTDSQVKDIALLFFYHPTSKASCYAYRDNKLVERICQSLTGKANTGSIANAKIYSLF